MKLVPIVIGCGMSLLICGPPAVAQKVQIALAVRTAAPRITVSVDAREAPRKIFHSRLTIPAPPGTLTLYYPKWIPGEHGPTGPIQDLAGLTFTANGQTLKWRRDLLDGWTFHVEIPAGVSSVEAALDLSLLRERAMESIPAALLRPIK